MAELGAAAGAAAAGADAGAAAGGDAAAGAGGGCYCPENQAEDRESKLAMEVFEKLKDLQCPFLKGLHIKQPETVKQLLCTPSKYRMDILQWMYTRACPSSAPVLNPTSRTPEEAKIQVMLSVSRELMLTGPVTGDILMPKITHIMTAPQQQEDREEEGVAGFGPIAPPNGEEVSLPPECCPCCFLPSATLVAAATPTILLPEGRGGTLEQLRLIEELLDAVRSMATGCLIMSSVERQFKKTREENEKILGSLFSSPHLRSLLRPDCKARVNTHVYDSKRKVNDDKTVLVMVKQLQESVDKLEVLRAEHKKAVGVGSAEAGILEQKLRLVISDFHQLVLAFLQVYDKELSECCNLDCPFIHPLGPIVETVCRTLISCRKLLKAVLDVTETSANAVETAEKQQEGGQSYGASVAMSLAAKMEELIQKYKLFSVSLKKRLEEGFDLEVAL
uniref:HAUS augmin like complex subunit 7 n=1 Tax=Myotis myotis TaxID=51298 RepID=A0A7J7YCY0_MYOMY|nr:HAUS augmin like complex subunit 7 [Myotis myotis]